MKFIGDSPCNNCPYRKDAPLAHWHKSEFTKLLNQDEQWGRVYGCHKKNDGICVGWLMDQLDHGTPNINLRLKMMRDRPPQEYFDALHCDGARFKSVRSMVNANLKKIKE